VAERRDTFSELTELTSVATVNRDLALGSALFRLAIEAEYVEDNVFRRVARFSEKGRAREVYLTAPECETLLTACSDESCLLGLRDRRTVPLKGPDRVFLRARKRWQGQTVLDHLARAVAACGDELPEAKRTDLHFHDLRHTTASLFVAAGVPIFDVLKILEHKPIETTMRYSHLAPESGRRAIDGLAAALGTKTATNA
jgi:site-specific recombinase XerD